MNNPLIVICGPTATGKNLDHYVKIMYTLYI